MAFLFANNTKTTLAAAVTSGATTVTLASGSGAKFPNPSGSDQFTLTIVDAATGNNTEIMYCTSRTGDVCTVTRAREGTTAQNWAIGDFANNCLTATVAADFLQGTGALGTMAIQNANAVAITGGNVAADLAGSTIDGTNHLAGMAAQAPNSVAITGGTIAADLAGSTTDGTHAPLPNLFTALGDMVSGGASGTPTRTVVGTTGDVWTADPTAPGGASWQAPGSGGSTNPPPVNAQTGTAYTLVLTDAPTTSACAGIVTMNNTAANVLTVPTHATVAFAKGTTIQVPQLGAGSTSVAGQSGVTILTPSTLIARVQNSTLLLTNLDGADTWLLSGDMQ